jgi:hypothetical protein
MARGENARVRGYSTGESRSFVRSRLIDFVRNRFSPPPVNAVISAIPFTVINNINGLTIYYSPAYFFVTNNVFGAPSSPVHGTIRAGRYMFGGAGPSFPKQFETGSHFDIPKLSTAVLTQL